MHSSRLDRLAPRGCVTDEAGAGESHQPAPATLRPRVIRHRKWLVAFYDSNMEALHSESVLCGSLREAFRICDIAMNAEQRHRAAHCKIEERETALD